MAVGLFHIHDILDTFVFHPRSRATLVSRPEVSRCSRDTFGTPRPSKLGTSFIKVQGAVITLYHEKAALLLHATAPAAVVVKHAPNLLSTRASASANT